MDEKAGIDIPPDDVAAVVDGTASSLTDSGQGEVDGRKDFLTQEKAMSAWGNIVEMLSNDIAVIVYAAG